MWPRKIADGIDKIYIKTLDSNSKIVNKKKKKHKFTTNHLPQAQISDTMARETSVEKLDPSGDAILVVEGASNTKKFLVLTNILRPTTRIAGLCSAFLAQALQG